MEGDFLLVRLRKSDEARREAPAAVAAIRLCGEEAKATRNWRLKEATDRPALLERHERFAAGGEIEEPGER